MKSLILIIFFIYSAFSYEYTVKPNAITDDIYCFFGAPEVMNKHNNGNISNSCYVDLGSSYLVIDTGPSYKYARDTYNAMQRIKKQKVSHVIITHIHDDHWLGNGFYKEIGTTIIGPEIFANTPKVKTTRMQRRISKEAYEGTTQVYPSEFVMGRKNMTINNTQIELKTYDYKNHSVNDLIVYIPSKNVVFAGDLVFNDRILSLRDGNINNWIETLNEIDSRNIKYVVGGHGELHTKESTKTTLSYLKDMKKVIQDSIDEGLDISETLDACDLPKYKNINFYDTMHRANVEKAYRTLEWAE